MRDICSFLYYDSTHGGDNFATDSSFTTCTVTLHTITGGDDSDSQALKGTWKIFGSAIYATPALRYPFNLVNHLLATRAVLQANSNQTLTAIFDVFKFMDVTLFNKNLSDPTVELVAHAGDAVLPVPH